MSDEEAKAGPIVNPNRRITVAKPKRITGTTGKSRPAQFVLKLWSMVNDPKNQKYIRWMPDGQSFQVLDREEFMMQVLPQYFKHKNFSSFVRQLNMYGWHKVQDVTSGAMQSTDEMWQFESPYFKKGREDLLDSIVRNRGSKGSDDEEESLGSILKELQHIRGNQEEIGEDLQRIKKDNQMLWNESYQSRERHQKHAETLDRILRFLASLYGNQGKLLGDMISPGKLHGPQKLLMGNTSVTGSTEEPLESDPITELPTFDNSGNRISSAAASTPGSSGNNNNFKDENSPDVNNLALTLADRSSALHNSSLPLLNPGNGASGYGDIPRTLFPELYDSANAALHNLDDHDQKIMKNGLKINDVTQRVEDQEHSLQQVEDWIAKLAPEYDEDTPSSIASEHFNVDDFLNDPEADTLNEQAAAPPLNSKSTKRRRTGN
jgi:heat shock transcription factor